MVDEDIFFSKSFEFPFSSPPNPLAEKLTEKIFDIIPVAPSCMTDRDKDRRVTNFCYYNSGE